MININVDTNINNILYYDYMNRQKEKDEKRRVKK